MISGGAAHWQLSANSGDLPSSITLDPALPGTAAASGDEGTAMMEIVHDYAPGASLYFAGGLGSSTDMASAIDWMVSTAHVNVIVDDLSFFSEPWFTSGVVSNAAQAAVQAGVTYLTSAGNYAQAHYLAPYAQGPASGNGNWHNFTSAADLDSVTIGPGGTLRAFLQWSDAWGASTNAYGLYLLNAAGNTILASYFQPNTSNPFEVVTYTNTGTSPLTVNLAVNRFPGAAARQIEIFLTGGVFQNYTNASFNTPGSALIGQEAASGVLAIGAANASSPSTIELFSSQGPGLLCTNFSSQTFATVNNLVGIGVDNVKTEIGNLGYFPVGQPGSAFFGTSAAAPSIAGIAALLLQENPGMSPAAVAAALEGTAIDLGTAGYDQVYGFGRFDALNAVYHLYTPTAPALVGNGHNLAGYIGSATPTFTGTAPASAYVALYVDGSLVGSQQLTGGATTYSITASALAIGAHTAAIRVSESAATLTGNPSNLSSATAFTITSPLAVQSVAQFINSQTSLDYLVTFNEAVQSVPTTALVASYGASQFGAVQTPTFVQTNPDGSVVWKFRVTGLQPNQTIALTLVSNSDVYDRGGNLLQSFGSTFKILPGDANSNGRVTGADYTIWADHFLHFPSGGATWQDGDFSGDGSVTGADYTIWADNFAPAALAAESALAGVRFFDIAGNQDGSMINLYLGASGGDDWFTITQVDATTVLVHYLKWNGQTTGLPEDETFYNITGRVYVYGLQGNVTIDARELSSMSLFVSAGDGDDTVYGSSGGANEIHLGDGDDTVYGGGAGNQVYVGNGNDTLVGGSDGAEGQQCDNVLVAGNGNNTIYGNIVIGRVGMTGGNNLIVLGNGDNTIYANFEIVEDSNGNLSNGGEGGQNLVVSGGGHSSLYATGLGNGAEGGHGSILIAGTTSLDVDALESVLAEWTSDDTLATKVASISGTPSGHNFNGNNFLIPGVTVFDNGAVDYLYSGTSGSANWLFYNVNEDIAAYLKASDIISDLA
ncbi:MAG: S8 family serine peptidase [Pirellulales bacterium]|nr:S8 family serine peptidase [Pirellulales bacterium]